MNSGVYSITNQVNNKVYIGCTSCLKNRKSYHFSYLRRNLHPNKHLQASYNKYGPENFVFDIIELCSVKEMYSKEHTYCLSLGVHDPSIGYNQRETNENNKPVCNDIMKAKIREGIKNGKRPEYSIERRGVHSDTLKKRGWTKKMLDKRSETRAIPIVYFDKQWNYLGEFKSTKEASNNLEINPKYINSNLNNKCFNTHGFIFIYKRNYLGNGIMNLNLQYD